MQRDFTRVLIPFVYFIAGATSLASVAATFYYKEDLQLSIAQVSLLGSLSILPWSIKPIYGFLSDRLPVWKLRRKPYLFLAGLLSALGYFSMATWVKDFQGALVATLIQAFGFALADVIVDAIVVEKSRSQKEAGKLQSICRAAIMTGALIVAYLSGILVTAVGPRNVFIITGSLPLLTCIFAFLIEEPISEVQSFSIRDTWRKLKGSVTAPLLWAVLFIFIWRSTPTSGGALSYFEIDVLGFTPEFFGRLSLISHAMGIAGVLIFRKFLIAVSLRKLFFWIVVASIVLSLPTMALVYGWYKILGVSPQLFAMADTFISAPLSEIAFLPLLVLAARLCPKGIEATMFAILASLMNIGLAISDLGGAALVTIFNVHQATDVLPADYSNLHIVLWIAILSSVLPLPFLGKLPDVRAVEEKVPDISPSKESPIESVLGSEKSEIV